MKREGLLPLSAWPHRAAIRDRAVYVPRKVRGPLAVAAYRAGAPYVVVTALGRLWA